MEKNIGDGISWGDRHNELFPVFVLRWQSMDDA